MYIYICVEPKSANSLKVIKYQYFLCEPRCSCWPHHMYDIHVSGDCRRPVLTRSWWLLRIWLVSERCVIWGKFMHKWPRFPWSLQWPHNDRDCISNHQRLGCLLNRLLRRRSKKTSKLHVTGLCKGNTLVTGEFSAQRASNAENVSIGFSWSWSFNCGYAWYFPNN